MTNGNPVMSEKFFALKMFMLFLAGSVALIVIQRYYPLFIRPMFIALGATLAFAGFRREMARRERDLLIVVAALNAASQSMSAEIQELRDELRRQGQDQETRTAGFQGPANGRK